MNLMFKYEMHHGGCLGLKIYFNSVSIILITDREE